LSFVAMEPFSKTAGRGEERKIESGGAREEKRKERRTSSESPDVNLVVDPLEGCVGLERSAEAGDAIVCELSESAHRV
jgi:hypothetical protein